jgi:hypothetical protein
VPGLLLAQVTSDNAPGGANFTLWFPLGLFCIVAAILWVLYTRPHRRTPPRRPAQSQAGSTANGLGAGAEPGERDGRTQPGYTATGPADAGDHSSDADQRGPQGTPGDDKGGR